MVNTEYSIMGFYLLAIISFASINALPMNGPNNGAHVAPVIIGYDFTPFINSGECTIQHPGLKYAVHESNFNHSLFDTFLQNYDYDWQVTGAYYCLLKNGIISANGDECLFLDNSSKPLTVYSQTYCTEEPLQVQTIFNTTCKATGLEKRLSFPWAQQAWTWVNSNSHRIKRVS